MLQNGQKSHAYQTVGESEDLDASIGMLTGRDGEVEMTAQSNGFKSKNKSKRKDVRHEEDTEHLLGSSERAPTQVSERRGLALCVVSVLFCALLSIVVIESLVNADSEKGLQPVQLVAPGRSDVYLLRFENDGIPVKWSNDAIVSSSEFVKTTVDALSQIPFEDFSVEMRIISPNSAIEIACIAEENRKIAVQNHECSPDQKRVISQIASFSVDRCEQGASSPLRNAVKCANKAATSEETQLEKAELNQFWLTTFAEALPGTGLSSRCCDYDHVIIDMGKQETLEMCRAMEKDLSSSGVDFFRYYGHEQSSTCTETLCGCECFADKKVSKGVLGRKFNNEGCPKLPTNDMFHKDLCGMIASKISGDPKCSDLVALERDQSEFLRDKEIDLGDHPRCYGTFSGTVG